MTLHDVALDDKFDLGKERIFLSGAQAVIRMLLMQRERDRRHGLNTAGFVSGYRGSPLGGLDLQLWKAKKQLAEANIVFQPGLNEELAATACWGSQQTELLGEGKHDGVFCGLVRQGSRRRPLRRRFPPRQSRRIVEAWRRAGPDGRRPHGRILDHRACHRIRCSSTR